MALATCPIAADPPFMPQKPKARGPMHRTIFIHAGMHKTGSTAIQRFLTGNADRLRALGIYLPVAGTEVLAHNHTAIVRAVARFDQTDAGGVFDRLRSELTQAGYPRQVLISTEDFSPKFGRPPFLHNLARFCIALGYAPHVVVYVRPQAAAINSLFTQRVKNWRAVAPFHEYFRAQLAAPLSQFPHLFAALRADRRFRLTVRPYSRQIITTGLIGDFLTVLGLPPDDPRLTHSSDPVNVAPGPKTVAAFVQIRRRLAEQEPMLDPAILRVLTRPLIAAAGQHGWNDTKFDGIDENRLRHAHHRFAASNQDFAQAVWRKSWLDVFPEEQDRHANPNIFILSDATPAERAEFRDFLNDAIATIRRFDAGAVQSRSGDLDDSDD
ncbi:MAG: hypothetical protein ACT4SY_14400 [Hyphomicrobiales bacterium]